VISLAVIVVVGLASLLGSLVDSDWLPAEADLWSRWGFPEVRLAFAVAVLVVASPELIRAVRTVATWLVLLAAVGTVALEAASPSRALAGLALGLAAGAFVELLVRNPGKLVSQRQVLQEVWGPQREGHLWTAFPDGWITMVGMTSVERKVAESAVPGRAAELVRTMLGNIETVVHGKHEEVALVLAALACEGHVLLEDVPGTAKTVLARALAGSVEGATVSRIQCTPDLQPTDVTGLSVWDPQERRFEFRPGPIFANVLLVDEINRALPKAQSALLEGMAERQVTVDGTSRPLPTPFLLIATENSIEQEGTFPLPEAQLDRFFLRTSLGYPTLEQELEILDNQLHGHPLGRLRPVVAIADLAELVAAVEEVYIDPLLKRWAVELIRATRDLEQVEVGASVRASLSLDRAVRAWALFAGRSYVVPADVERLFEPVVGHRLVLGVDFAVDAESLDREQLGRVIWDACLARAPRPQPDWDEDRFRSA
jgi:MoxR-like ATPase